MEKRIRRCPRSAKNEEHHQRDQHAGNNSRYGDFLLFAYDQFFLENRGPVMVFFEIVLPDEAIQGSHQFPRRSSCMLLTVFMKHGQRRGVVGDEVVDKARRSGMRFSYPRS